MTSTIPVSIENALPVISISSSADRVQSVEAITEPKVDSLPGNNSNSVQEKALRHPIANDGTILNSPSVNRTNSGKVITDKVKSEIELLMKRYGESYKHSHYRIQTLEVSQSSKRITERVGNKEKHPSFKSSSRTNRSTQRI